MLLPNLTNPLAPPPSSFPPLPFRRDVNTDIAVPIGTWYHIVTPFIAGCDDEHESLWGWFYRLSGYGLLGVRLWAREKAAHRQPSTMKGVCFLLNFKSERRMLEARKHLQRLGRECLDLDEPKQGTNLSHITSVLNLDYVEEVFADAELNSMPVLRHSLLEVAPRRAGVAWHWLERVRKASPGQTPDPAIERQRLYGRSQGEDRVKSAHLELLDLIDGRYAPQPEGPKVVLSVVQIPVAWVHEFHKRAILHGYNSPDVLALERMRMLMRVMERRDKPFWCSLIDSDGPNVPYLRWMAATCVEEKAHAGPITTLNERESFGWKRQHWILRLVL